MAFRIEFTLGAETDLDDLLTWLIARDTGQAGLRWLVGLMQAVDRLQTMPERCSLYRRDHRLGIVRQLFYGRKPHVFRILFRIEENTVYILRVRRGHINQPLH